MKANVLILIPALALCGHARANEADGWYSKVAVNRTSIDFSTSSAETVISSDGTETGFDVSFGYRFTPNFGLELGYADLGDHRVRQACPEDLVCATVVQDVEVNPTTVSLLGTATLPLNDGLSAYLVLGAANIDTEIGDGTEIEAGLGATWQLDNTLDLDLRYSRLAFDPVDDFDLFELGLRYAF